VLNFVEPAVQAARCDKLFVPAGFDDPAMVEDVDPVGTLERG
jgi:hypothetical protein